VSRAHDTYVVAAGGSLHGRFTVPGDKSISHRALMLGAIAEGRSVVRGFLESEDTLATRRALEAMGVAFESRDATLGVHGVGLHGLRPPAGPLDLGNSGTSLRLLSGLLAGQGFAVTLTGDASLMRRPMGRVVAPLAAMNARIACSADGTPPVSIDASPGLRGIRYALPVASAQVKSAVLLAGLYADGETCVSEPAPSRDHTERMLARFGVPIEREGGRACVRGGATLTATEVDVPADLSSAAFFMVGAAIGAGSRITIDNVGVNPTRTGVVEILRLMGADIVLHHPRTLGGEPVADIEARCGDLRGVEIPPELVPLAIDEFPALLVAAACARGRTRLTGAGELRVKESDRIAAMAEGLHGLGIETEVAPDGITVIGGALRGGEVDSRGDHRVAMAFAMAALRAEGEIRIARCRNVATSFPGFAALARRAGLRIR
jgi:3-phosphoshikimate 1-carboxyvinyltransferase